jgi:energy-coupling factor transporter ATP-binding protein EcfA2
MSGSSSDFQVYFALSRKAVAGLDADSILICPAGDNWNDFGYQTLFDFCLVKDDREPAWRRFRIAFLDTDAHVQADILEMALAGDTSGVLAKGQAPAFFSMQLDVANYAALVQEYGLGIAKDILRSLHDIVLATTFPPIPDWVAQAVRADVFNLSFLRSPGGFGTYYRGGQVLLGNVIDAATPPERLCLDFQLPGFDGPHHVDVRFVRNALLSKRIAVIVGKNGVGKSRTLNALTRAVIDRAAALHDGSGRPVAVARLLAVCTPGETEATFPPPGSNRASVEYRRLLALPGQRVQDGEGTLPSVLQQLARTDAMDDGAHRWEIFRQAVSRFVDFRDLAVIPRAPASDQPLPYDLTRALGAVDLESLSYGGEKARLEAASRMDKNGALVRRLGGEFLPLSSGQISFVRLAAQICLHIQPGSLLLIDEPETHLHPNLITDFAALLNAILEIADSVAVIATHSAYLVREVPTSQVHLIQVQDGAVAIGRPRIRTFGADVGTISNFIFDDGFINRLSAEVGEKIQKAGLHEQQWMAQLRDELSDEAIMYLKRYRDARRDDAT